MEYTRIRITKKLQQELKQLGRKGETYEDVIGRLMKEARDRYNRHSH